MTFEQGATDRQSQAETSPPVQTRIVCLLVGALGPIEILLAHADAGVVDRDDRMIPVFTSRDAYMAAIGELYGIADQVEDHLVQAVGVGLHEREVVRDVGLQPDRARADQRATGLHYRVEEGDERRRSWMDGQLPVPQLGQRDGVVDQSCQSSPALYDQVEAALQPGVVSG